MLRVANYRNQDRLATKVISKSCKKLIEVLFHSSPGPVCISTLDEGQFIAVSDSWVRLVGFQREDIIGKTAFEIGFWLKRHDRQEIVSTLKKYKIMRDHEIRYRTGNGQERMGMMSAEVVSVDGKQLMISVLDDVTDRRRAEEVARESSEFNSILLANSPNPIVVSSYEGSVEYVNPAFESLTNFSSEEVVGITPPYPWSIPHMRSRRRSRIKQAINQGTIKYDMLFKKKSGERFSVEVSLAPVWQKGKVRYCLETWNDTTEQRRLADDRQVYIGVAIKAQEEERKRIARELHDETIQAIASLRHQVHTMMATETQLSVELMPELHRLDAKLATILEGVRRFSHSLRPAPLDTLGLVSVLESLVADVRAESSIECYVDISGSERRLPAEVELALFRITQEALCNVRKHSDASKAVVKVMFYNKKIKLSIADNGIGCGLPESLTDLVKDGKVGLLGMKERAGLVGGTFSINSRRGKGTRVSVEVARV